jgi:hypothetical protein
MNQEKSVNGSRDEFFVTVYTRQGYSGIIAIQRGLEAIGIDSGITTGGLSVWGGWDKYEAFAAEIDLHDGATFQGGPSVHEQAMLDRLNTKQ